MDAAKFFPPENTTSAFYKFSIVRENSAQRQKQHKNTKKKKNEERNARSGRGKNQKKKGSDNCVLSQHDCCSIFTVFSDRWLRHFAREARTGDTLTAGSHFKWIFSDS